MGEIILSNMIPTLNDSFVTHPLGIVQEVLVHVDSLVFPAYFMVIEMKADLWGSVILGRSLLETGERLIDVEIGKLILKFNKEKVVFNVYECTPYMDDLETCYQLEEKGSNVDKGMKASESTCVRVSFTSNMPEAWGVKLMKENKR